MTEAFTVRLPGQAPLAFAIDMTLSGFDESVEPIAAPPSYDVMSMATFRRITGSNLAVA